MKSLTMELGANSSVKGTFKVRCSAGMKSFGLCRDRNNFNKVKVHLLAIEFLMKSGKRSNAPTKILSDHPM